VDHKEETIIKHENGDFVLSPEIVVNYLAEGGGQLTKKEVIIFINTCKYQQLNPFLKEIYIIKGPKQNKANTVISKDVFTKRASKHPQSDGWIAGVIVECENGEKKENKGSLVATGERLIGAWCTVRRKDWKVEYTNTVNLSEYVKNIDGPWKNMRATMIRKIAIVTALREVYPDSLAGLYTEEEIEKIEPVGEPIKFDDMMEELENGDFKTET